MVPFWTRLPIQSWAPMTRSGPLPAWAAVTNTVWRSLETAWTLTWTSLSSPFGGGLLDRPGVLVVCPDGERDALRAAVGRSAAAAAAGQKQHQPRHQQGEGGPQAHVCAPQTVRRRGLSVVRPPCRSRNLNVQPVVEKVVP